VLCDGAESAPADPEERTVPVASLRGVTLDCADPQALAAFYRALTGMRELFASEEYVALTGDSGCDLGFQRVDRYRRPQWPGQDVPQQLHLDFRADDLDASEQVALGLGAVRPDHLDSGNGRWRVLLDPAGHPFCLTAS
jgi:catechol 2,3-dioxygenase-like lactoylglutathione lyase family enzyme